MCSSVISNSLKSHNSCSLFLHNFRTPEPQARQRERLNKWQLQQLPDPSTPCSLVFLSHCQVSLASSGTGKLSSGVKVEVMDPFS